MERIDQHEALQQIAASLLEVVGENGYREGLLETPRRFADAWMEFLHYEDWQETTFESTTSDQMVAVSGIQVYSLCEHHLLPFSVSLSLAYLTRERVLGLSKFARIALRHAHKLQLQERLCADIAADIMQITGSPDVAVIGDGLHLCLAMRGVQQREMRMHTSILQGKFRQPAARQELFALLEGQRR